MQLILSQGHTTNKVRTKDSPTTLSHCNQNEYMHAFLDNINSL